MSIPINDDDEVVKEGENRSFDSLLPFTAAALRCSHTSGSGSGRPPIMLPSPSYFSPPSKQIAF